MWRIYLLAEQNKTSLLEKIIYYYLRLYFLCLSKRLIFSLVNIKYDNIIII